ncbi:snaclec coagulation factor IX-binding protein subunit A-like [Anticarsia gemmatalis]|uniref:snaclec coagulation factor IX-binding protein subunit A-like n=1 Tax=Anticarsia gemmatalis TaxID=129554 RepID=UPI003F75F522
MWTKSFTMFAISVTLVLMAAGGVAALPACSSAEDSMAVMRAASDNIICNTTDNGYIYDYEVGTCYKHCRLMESWVEAQNSCVADGGYLVVANDEREARALMDFFTRTGHYYNTWSMFHVGLRRKQFYEEWFTVLGDPLELVFHEWDGGSAKDSGDCVAIIDTSGRLHNVRCSSKHQYICEKDPLPWTTVRDRIPYKV